MSTEVVALGQGQLHAGEQGKARVVGPQAGKLLARPVAVVLGEDERVQAPGQGQLAGPLRIEPGAGRVARGVEVAVDAHAGLLRTRY